MMDAQTKAGFDEANRVEPNNLEFIEAEDNALDLCHGISNADFLEALFGSYLNADDRIYAWVCAHGHDFPEGEKKALPGIWSGHEWRREEIGDGGLGAAKNTYFGLALWQPFAKPGDVLSIRVRQKPNFYLLPCIMLDDIGTKANSELILKPTWMIETSPGNFQAGYVFRDPIESRSDAELLFKALGAASGVTDGGGQSLTRYARLPVGFNLKQKHRGENGEPFRHRLSFFRPDLRYPWRDVAEALGLDLDIHEPIRSRKARSGHRGFKSEVDVDADEVYQAKPSENPVLSALRNAGLYKQSFGSGKHDITCPWVSEHTDQIDHGTAYWEPDETFTRGGFKCQHGHCVDRRLHDLLEFLHVSPSEAKHRDTIRVIGGALHTIVGHAEGLMAAPGHYFQQGGLIVQIVTDPRGETRVIPLTKTGLQLTLTKLATWQRFDKRSDDWYDIDAPVGHSAALLEAPEYRRLSPLLALTRQPFIRPDGTVCQSSGYDPATFLYGVFNPRQFPVNSKPTLEQARAALDRLSSLLDGFEFKSPSDFAAALSAILTATVRTSLSTAPGFLATAHVFGSGKSFLLSIIAMFATPDQPASTTFVTDDDEMRKQLISTLMESPPVILFDEMTGDLIPVKCLLAALTAERIEGRILGVSKMARPSTRTLMLFAGNNVQAMQDMTRRVLTIRLDPQCETPAAREFKTDPLQQIRAKRGDYIADALTVISAWQGVGCPKADVRPLNGFSQWAEWCRQPLLWLGMTDPCETLFDQMGEDPDRELLSRLLRTWNSCFGTTPCMVRDLVKWANDVADLHDALIEIAGYRDDIDRRRLGRWLKNHTGRIVDGMRLERDTTFRRNSECWRLTLLS